MITVGWSFGDWVRLRFPFGCYLLIVESVPITHKIDRSYQERRDLQSELWGTPTLERYQFRRAEGRGGTVGSMVRERTVRRVLQLLGAGGHLNTAGGLVILHCHIITNLTTSFLHPLYSNDSSKQSPCKYFTHLILDLVEMRLHHPKISKQNRDTLTFHLARNQSSASHEQKG